MRPFTKIVLFLLAAAISVAGYLFLLSVFRDKAGPFSTAIPAFGVAAMAATVNWLFLRAENRSLATLGFQISRTTCRRVAIAFAGGALLASLWAVAIRVVTMANWQSAARFDVVAASGALIFTIFNNLAEELIYRGYLFLLVSREYGNVAAVAGTSILFTVMHVQAGVPWPSAIAGVLTSAIVFSLIFIRWHAVPVVLAFHAATNVVQEILGLRATALTVVAPRYAAPITKTQSLSILCAVAIMNLAVAVWLVASRNRQGVESMA